MFFNKFPFTTYEKINLDWLLTKMQECIDAVSNFVVDTVLDITSNHAIANKAVTQALNTKLTVNNDRVSYNNLDTNLQNAYNNANSALQSVPYTYRTAAEQDIIDDTKQDILFPSGVNISDVNSIVKITGVNNGIPTFGTIQIDRLYRGIKTYYSDVGGLAIIRNDTIYDDKISFFIYAGAGSATKSIAFKICLLNSAGNTQNYIYTVSSMIHTDPRVAELIFTVKGRCLWVELNIPGPPSTNLSRQVRTLAVNSTNSFTAITKYEISVTQGNFPDKSFMVTEERQIV